MEKCGKIKLWLVRIRLCFLQSSLSLRAARTQQCWVVPNAVTFRMNVEQRVGNTAFA